MSITDRIIIGVLFLLLFGFILSLHRDPKIYSASGQGNFQSIYLEFNESRKYKLNLTLDDNFNCDTDSCYPSQGITFTLLCKDSQYNYLQGLYSPIIFVNDEIEISLNESYTINDITGDCKLSLITSDLSVWQIDLYKV